MQTVLLHLAARLPPGARRHVTDERLRLLVQFMQFATVGLAGLVIDTATVYGLRGWLGLYGAGLAAYGTGATTTWLLNRIWTFRGQGSGPMHHQWARFLMANLGGFVLNRGTYAILVTVMPLAARQPVIATAAGAVAGMFLNFSLSRRLVFR
ncbi:MAG: GtrA family protein [Acetobacteraceae bacterium]|nr:GtrA family protein [Acetobacteraceae bacterium]